MFVRLPSIQSTEKLFNKIVIVFNVIRLNIKQGFVLLSYMAYTLCWSDHNRVFLICSVYLDSNDLRKQR